MPTSGNLPLEPGTSAGVGEALGRLWAASHELELLSKRMLARLGVTGPQRLVLRLVGMHPAISAGGIAAGARLHASTLTGMLERLQRRGFITRDRDIGDARRAQFRLTPEGERVAAVTVGTVEAAMTASLAGLSPADGAVVRRWLEDFALALAEERRRLGDTEPPPS